MNEAEIKNCLVCRLEIRAYGSSRRRATKKFCSVGCRGAYQTFIGLEVHPCVNCGKEVRISGSRKNKRFKNRYCSLICYGITKRGPDYKDDESLKIRKSWDYTKWRKSVFERDNYTCVFCKKHGGKLNADHIKPFSYFPELRLDINNGRTLCVECHRLTPTYGGRQKFKV